MDGSAGFACSGARMLRSCHLAPASRSCFCPVFVDPPVAHVRALLRAGGTDGRLAGASGPRGGRGKTLRVVFPIAETSFDPAFASDAASDGIISIVFDAMLDYDYLARPVTLVPRTLDAMPR